MTKKTTQFKRLLHSGKLEFLMEAHNGLTAKLVEEAGFKGIWASGLTLSAAMGVRDSNEASWTQVLEVVELMSDASSIPILLDADTGYGNFNNVRRLVRKLEQRNIPAMCIEDKVFPRPIRSSMRVINCWRMLRNLPERSRPRRIRNRIATSVSLPELRLSFLAWI